MGGGLTVCVTCVWAGVDSVWEQEKLEARKMPENAAEAHPSSARFVGRVYDEAKPFFLRYKITLTRILTFRYLIGG